MKRFYHIGITPVTLNKMILDIADTVYKSNHQFNKEKYRRFFGQLVITLKNEYPWISVMNCKVILIFL